MAAGAEVHLAHPLGVRAYAGRRVKNDVRDAADLADFLRMGRLSEAWIAPAFYRQLRELTSYRRKLTSMRTSCKDQVHAVLAGLGIPVTRSDLFGKWGSQWLDELTLPQPYKGKVASLRGLIAMLDAEITTLTTAVAQQLASRAGGADCRQVRGLKPAGVGEHHGGGIDVGPTALRRLLQQQGPS